MRLPANLLRAGPALRALVLLTLASRALAADQGEPDLGELPDYGSELVRMLLSLGVVLGLLVVAAWLLPRWIGKRRPPTPGRHLEVVETMRLDSRRTLYLVRVAGELVLIGAGEGGLVRLSSAPAGSQPFAERLRSPSENPGDRSEP